ncbi:MFS transporter [Neobacillus vireti]|uniref:MFS transporter n=1 Tax=Neobacillus vireti TaxID=220686 RepID=UPI002FFDEDB7
MAEIYQWKKTPYLNLIIAAFLGVGTSVGAIVILNFGLIQFNIIRLVGPDRVTAVFGTASGISSLAALVLGLIGGVIADKTRLKFGRRRFWMIAGSIGGALSMLGLTYAVSIPMLIIAWCLLQFFYSMVSLSCYAIVAEQVDPEKFGRASGLIGAAFPAFVMLGQMIMGAFSDSSVQSKLIVIIFVQLICGVVAAALVKDNNFSNAVAAKKKGFIWKEVHNFYPSFKQYPSFTWALLTKIFIQISNAGLTLMTLFYIARFHFSEGKIFQINGITSPSIMVMVAAGLIGGFLSDKVKKQKPFVIGAALILAICWIIFAFSFNITWIIIGNFVLNFGFGMFSAVDSALVNRILPSKETAGKDLSIINNSAPLANSLVNFLAPALIGLGVSWFGGDGYIFFFLVLAASAVFSALSVILIPELGTQQSNQSEMDETPLNTLIN